MGSRLSLAGGRGLWCETRVGVSGGGRRAEGGRRRGRLEEVEAKRQPPRVSVLSWFKGAQYTPTGVSCSSPAGRIVVSPGPIKVAGLFPLCQQGSRQTTHPSVAKPINATVLLSTNYFRSPQSSHILKKKKLNPLIVSSQNSHAFPSHKGSLWHGVSRISAL
jgi:hypothetical protein